MRHSLVSFFSLLGVRPDHPSPAITGYHRPSPAITGRRRLWISDVTIYTRVLQPSPAITGHHRLSPAITGDHRLTKSANA
jgi:hypothetical protein